MTHKGPFMEFLQGALNESAANTYTEVEVSTPASKTEKMAMLIHAIELVVTFPDSVDGTETSVFAHVAKDTKTTFANFGDKDVIYFQHIDKDCGVAQGTLSEFVSWQVENPSIVYFDPPILYPKASIFIGIFGVSNANAMALEYRIHYTLEEVSERDFIAALVD